MKEYSQREVGPDRADDTAWQGQADVTRQKNRRVHSPPDPERRIVQVSEGGANRRDGLSLSEMPCPLSPGSHAALHSARFLRFWISS